MSEGEKIRGRNGRKAVVAIFAAAILIASVMPFIFSDDSNAGCEVLGAGSTAPATSAGSTHSLALKGDGTVWAWGNNSHGRLGDGTTTDSPTPVQVMASADVPLTGVTAISALGAHSLALKSDGTVWAWGSNTHGQLGDGTTTDSPTPVQVSSLTGVTAVATGENHSLALKSDGTVWAWGNNANGRLGDGTTTDRLTPVQVSSLTGVSSITAGNYHSVALKSDGTVWAWGQNNDGQLGDGTTTDRLTPVQVLTGATAIAAGNYHSVALKSDGTVWAWGYNGHGQLGDGTTENRLTPVQAKGEGILTGVSSVFAGGFRSFALKTDGTVWAWGSNGSGQLGDGTLDSRSTPVQVKGEGGEGILTGVSSISVGVSHTLALKSDGTLWAWGQNYNGQLGDGTSGPGASKSTPVEIMSLAVDDGNSGLSTTVIIAIAAAVIVGIIIAAWFLLSRKRS